MKFNVLMFTKLVSRIHNKRIYGYIVTRQASAGLNLWDQPLTNEIRHNIEAHWKDKVGQPNKKENYGKKEKFYVLAMFPYPSGVLHMGHVRVYTISDTVARFYKLLGKHVIHPMGWDAFGLPAENAALERKVDPAEWTKQNIINMRKQLDGLGCSFDWEREITTCDPEYYRWTQYLFLLLHERGLVYQKEAYVNWDPIDQTVLAEEQVDSNNCSWRSGAKVEKKLLNQWFIRTTAFAKSLREGLDNPELKEWKDIIKMQKNWIGDSNGFSFEMQLISDNPSSPKTINLWTDKPEFIEVAKFVAVSPRNILYQLEMSDCANQTKNENQLLTKLNARVLNPFNGEELPIFATNKINFPIGRDNYLGIPAADMNDYEFSELVEIPFRRHKIRSFEEQQRKIIEITDKAKEWKIGGYPVSSRLTDWLISRQRYWGTPIPIVHCSNCGAQPIPKNQLPVVLPKIDSSFSERKSLRDAKNWLKTTCPKCGGNATRETDTMDTFVDSSWYFARFIDAQNTNEMFSSDKAKKYLPVDLYVGGKEHGVLHLYYARFVNQFLHSEGLVPKSEPFKQLLVQGMVMGKTYQLKSTGQYVEKERVDTDGKTFFEKSTGEPVVVTWQKMSKSKYNGVDPMDLFAEYGTDTTRLLISADVAPTSSRNWCDETIPGILNWQHRLWLSVSKFIKCRNDMSSEEFREKPTNEKFFKDEEYLFDSRNYFIKSATFNITDTQQLSVAISRLQGLTNSLRKVCLQCVKKGYQYERTLATHIIMLAPFAPHFASELWSGFCSAKHHLINDDEVDINQDVLKQSWPTIDMDYKMKLIVFVNKQEIIKLAVPRRILDEITPETALQLVSQEDAFQKRAKDCTLEYVTLDSKKSCDAKMYITMKKATQEVAET